MDCKDFDIYASSYLDGYLLEEEKEFFAKHLNGCEDCRVQYENLKMIINCVNEIPELPLPRNFSTEIGQRLRDETFTKGKIKFRTRAWKFAGGIAATLLLLVMSVSMLNNSFNKYTKDINPSDSPMEESANIVFDSGSNKEFYSADLDIAEDPEAETIRNFTENLTSQSESSGGMEKTSISTSRKIIERGHISLEVENFDKVHQDILSLVESSKGYIQHNEVYYQFLNRENPEESLKNANMELRIPSENFIEIFKNLKEFGTVVEENTSGEDITETYMDIDNQVVNLKLQEERLREILQKAYKVDDLLQIENELNRIRVEINKLTGTLKNYDSLVSMSTINVYIRQVKDKNIPLQSFKVGLWSRGKDNFIHSINGIILVFEKAFVGLFGILPPLILLIVVAGPIGYIAYKRFRKKR